MKKEYVVISEGFAELLNGAQPQAVAVGRGVDAATFATSSVGGARVVAKKAAMKRSFAPASAKPRPVSTRVVQLTDQELAREKRANRLTGRIFPVVHYFPQVVSLPGSDPYGKAVTFTPAKAALQPAAGSAIRAGAASSVNIEVVDAETGSPLKGIEIIGFATKARKNPFRVFTDAAGKAKLAFDSVKLTELWASPPHTYWSAGKSNVTAHQTVRFELATWQQTGNRALDILRNRAAAQVGQGEGVRVAVIDTGIGKHKDLNIAKNISIINGAVVADDRVDVQPHGTHVAGIIAGAPTKKSGALGIAPKAEIYGYRIFSGRNSGGSNSDLALAILQATNDKCDVINLSLSSGERDPLVKAALKFADDRGVLVIAAAGNHTATEVAFPASEKTVVSVGAMGCRTTYPKDSLHALRAVKPWGTTKTHFIARFSNSGANLICSSVGVAVVSTVPGGKFQAMDGTSMACPAVSAIAACLLSMEEHSEVLRMPPNKARSVAMRRLLYTACSSLGFDPSRQGKKGLPS
ncbi:S8 family serine peptidase [Paraburkholderia caledonica]|uniref:Subtilisin n=1 Tax=Paraburkholderia caledonica TaxID=134536 RepID=A0ABU1KZ02_9BURK|nr:S8 family serine peptidase [Paraburkholderia caledonica]MDR6376205.1 subtilisin [Paraburkholderia caledonica]